MDASEINVEFGVYSESFLDTQRITKIIGVEPTKTWEKGDQIRKNLFRQESAWIYSSGSIKSLFLEEVLDMLTQIILPNVFLLEEYIAKNKLNVKFDIVLKIANNQPPSHYLPKRFIHLCSKLNADVDTDIFLF